MAYRYLVVLYSPDGQLSLLPVNAFDTFNAMSEFTVKSGRIRNSYGGYIQSAHRDIGRVRDDDVSIRHSVLVDSQSIAGRWAEIAAVCLAVAVLVVVCKGRVQCLCLIGFCGADWSLDRCDRVVVSLTNYRASSRWCATVAAQSLHDN